MAKRARQAEATRHRIMDAAKELFLRDGYATTNLEQVAAGAGVTKPTVYSHFGSKEGLLLSVTQAHASAKAHALSSVLQPTGDTQADLTRFGELFMKRLMSDEAACWHRLALSQNAAHPEIGSSIFAAGPARVLAAMKLFMASEMKAGRLSCDDASIAAEQFLGLLLGLQPIRMMSGQKPLAKSRQRKRCAAAVSTFIAAFGVDA